MHAQTARLEELLHAARVSFEALSQRETWSYQQRWRECYCADVKARTGKWTTSRYDWEALLNDNGHCLLDTKALEAYQAATSNTFLVIPNAGPGWLCSAERMPDLADAPLEPIVFPPSLEWTMVFSHEGLIFSRLEWQKPH